MARLRRWLAAGAICLALVLMGLIGYSRYKRTKRMLADLPHRLGIDVKSETNGFTYSQSVKGRTLFTIHAAKAIQRENGKTTLHDVAITLYGAPGSNRTDSIRGAEFEYDQPNGVVKAAGEVHIDLAAPAQTTAPSPTDKRIQVTTSGLVFLQKLGVAATDQPMQFVYGDLRGTATGADYESDTGMLRLRSAVTADGVHNGQTIHLNAAAAEIDRQKELATLHTARILADKNTAAGDTVLLTMAKEGGIQAVEATGHASLTAASGVKAQSPKMHAHMTSTGKLDLVQMTGGVQFSDAGGSGSSNTAVVHFDNAGQPLQAVLDGGVAVEQTSASGKNSLVAPHVVAELMQDAWRKTQMREATATGGAVLRSVAAGKGGRTKTSVMRADTLHATTAVAGSRRYVDTVDGNGNTKVDEDDGAGGLRTFSGDTLHATLASAAQAGAKNGAGALKTAVQTGHVIVTQHTAAANGKPAQDSRATAGRADYEEATGKLVLTEQPQVTAPGLQIAAERISVAQGAGDSEATGGVSGTYVQVGDTGKSGDPVHVLADHATVSNGGAVAKFYGGAKPARMWTSSSQLEAPVVETERASGRLLAHGNSAADRVQLLLPQSAASGKGKGQGGAVRIVGGRVVYLPGDADHAAHADVSGGVRMDDAGSVLTAANAVATLAARGKGTAGALMGAVQSVLATGNVRLQQPGRTATGDRLVYTAADGRYELTGTTAAPPRVTDSLHGTVTGVSLIFHAGDDSVEVAGEPGRRVHTETDAATPSRGR